MHRIGVISDTHGLLREEVRDRLRNCDAILHGGDIHKQEIVDELKKIAPLYAVRGNADKEWAEDLPIILETTLFGIRITMVHNKKYLPEKLENTDLAVFGHSHKYTDLTEENLRWLNPGSCGPRRFHQPITMAIAEIEEDGIYEIHRIDIPHKGQEVDGPMPENRKDRRKLVLAVIKDVEKGKTVEKIAAGNHIGQELAEQICRMYLTHPGVDVDGILNRLGNI